jgi:hypothetical protein
MAGILPKTVKLIAPQGAASGDRGGKKPKQLTTGIEGYITMGFY